MRDYELIVVLNPTLSREATEACWERVKRSIQDRGGSVGHEEQWGTRRLAYRIRKVGQTFTEGTYILGRFQLDAALVREIEEGLRLMEEVLRFLIVRAEAPQVAAVKAETPQVVAAEPAPPQAAQSPDST